MELGPPTLAGLQHICRNLRARDREEIEAAEWAFDPDALAGRLLEAWRIAGLFGQVASLGGEPVAVLIFCWLTPAASSAGLLATERWGEIRLPFARHCRERIEPEILASGVRRIECRTLAGHADAIRFLEWFGAREECRCPGWGRNGETFIQYAWIREGES